jgi:ketosteroid isomerase-like protein
VLFVVDVLVDGACERWGSKMVTSADVDTVRRFYRAVADRDLAASESCFTPDAVWYLPGKSAIAGDHHGWPAIRDDFLARLGPLSGKGIGTESVPGSA